MHATVQLYKEYKEPTGDAMNHVTQPARHRRFLRHSLTAALLCSTLGATASFAAQEPLKIGFIGTL